MTDFVSSCSSGSACKRNNEEGFNNPTDLNTASCLILNELALEIPEEESVKPFEAVELREIVKERMTGMNTFADSVLNVFAISK